MNCENKLNVCLSGDGGAVQKSAYTSRKPNVKPYFYGERKLPPRGLSFICCFAMLLGDRFVFGGISDGTCVLLKSNVIDL
jgi:hypothetical protein